MRVRLARLCSYRAGDKADLVNVAVFAPDAEVYELVREAVTADALKVHLGDRVRGRVERYEAPNVLALNFVCHGALGGGGPMSLRADNLGKTFGGAVGSLEIDVPDSFAPRLRPAPDVTWADAILDALPHR